MGPGIRRYLVAVIGLFIVAALWRGWGSNSLSRSAELVGAPSPAEGQGQQQESAPGEAQQQNPSESEGEAPVQSEVAVAPDPDFFWRTIKQQYPVDNFRPLPVSSGASLPRIQARVGSESQEEQQSRATRQQTIKEAFKRCWRAYHDHAWLHDELTPVTGKSKDNFGGWGATLIDSLDTLWIMDMKDEFSDAVDTMHRRISFEKTRTEEINVFETTIRHLGGLLSAYDMSGDARLLVKATDVGDMLYKAFDTPNHLPATHWNLQAAAEGENQTALSSTLVAELGSLSMEFARLSLLTKDPKYYDAVQHISDLFAESQMNTKLAGMWPILINAADEDFDAGSDYSIGGMADSMYEYLPKMLALLGDGDSIYRDMYLQSMDTVYRNILYRPMLPDGDDILFAGSLHVEGHEGDYVKTLQTSTGHLTCFAGGMFALGGRLLGNQTHIDIGEKLTRGCIWAYKSTKTGVMPEVLHHVPCPDLNKCDWDESRWHQGIRDRVAADKQPNDNSAPPPVKEIIEKYHLPQGVIKIADTKYMLRPEAIESVFIMHRVTGHPYWRDVAWEMWESIDALTRTEMANSAVPDVNEKPEDEDEMSDSMESFWMGETLKYFYLIFSETSVLSLDEWVFNTEAHPFRRLG